MKIVIALLAILFALPTYASSVTLTFDYEKVEHQCDYHVIGPFLYQLPLDGFCGVYQDIAFNSVGVGSITLTENPFQWDVECSFCLTETAEKRDVVVTSTFVQFVAIFVDGAVETSASFDLVAGTGKLSWTDEGEPAGSGSFTLSNVQIVEVPAVPIPAGGWLMLSVLLLGHLVRRRLVVH